MYFNAILVFSFLSFTLIWSKSLLNILLPAFFKCKKLETVPCLVILRKTNFLPSCYFNIRVQIIRSHWFIAPLWFQSLKNLFPESDYLVTVFHATGAQWGVTHYIFALVTRNNLHYGRTRNPPLHKIGNIQSIKFKLTNDKIQTTNYNWKLLDSATTFDNLRISFFYETITDWGYHVQFVYMVRESIP